MYDDHWAWDSPTEDFFPLGDAKLENLKNFMRSVRWVENKKQVDIEKLIKTITKNRRYASQVYTVYKPEVEKMIEEIKQNGGKLSKNKKKAPKKKPTKVEKKIISFEEYKNNRLIEKWSA